MQFNISTKLQYLGHGARNWKFYKMLGATSSLSTLDQLLGYIYKRNEENSK